MYLSSMVFKVRNFEENSFFGQNKCVCMYVGMNEIINENNSGNLGMASLYIFSSLDH